MPQFEKSRIPIVIKNLKLAALTFIFYGFLAGVVVKKAEFFHASVINYDFFLGIVGIPIQVFRIFCAVILAYSTLRVLSMFHWEKQNALEERELRLRAITTTAPVILFVADNAGKLTFIEGRGLEELGLDSATVPGGYIGEIFRETPQLGEDCRRALENKEIFFTFTWKVKIFEAFYSPIIDKTDEVTGLIGVAIDITLHRKIQMELDSYRDELLKTRWLAELGTMSITMADQLREPLSMTHLLLQHISTDMAKQVNKQALKDNVQKGLEEISKGISVP